MDNDNPDARAAESLIDEWLENDRHTAVTAPVHSEAADQIDQWMIEDDAQLFANGSTYKSYGSTYKSYGRHK